MSENFLDHFVCPFCGSKELVEIQSMANIECGVSSLTYDSEGGVVIEYDYIETEDGCVEYFCCPNCNEEIKDETGEYITDYDELVDWIKAGCKAKGTGDVEIGHGYQEDEVDETFIVQDRLSPEKIAGDILHYLKHT